MDKKIVADEALLAKIRNAGDPAELCDAGGNTVAVVVSPGFYKDVFLAWADSQLTPEMIEENRRAVAEGRVKTTAEVLAHLASLDRQPSAGA
jgi:hypothetical protein